MDEIIYKYWLKRYETCKRCTFAKRSLLELVTCGTPVVGEIVTFEGKEIKLCGCIMKLKAKIESAECPLNFWNGNDTD